MKGDHNQQRSTELEKLQEDSSLQARQTIALEKIAEALDDVRREFRSLGNTLTRIAHRLGRQDD